MRLLTPKTVLCLIFVAGCSASSHADKPASIANHAEPTRQEANATQRPGEQVKPIAEPAPIAPNQGNQSMLRPSYAKCLDGTGGVTPEIQDCIADEYDFQDRRLNKVYQALLAKLSKDDQETLRIEQRKWISNRDAQCEFDNDAGQGQRLEANDCLLEMTARRAAELERR